MLENLKIAVRRQKKLIGIFLVTVLLPSVFLGVFGVIAIRNERFRRAEQIVTQHRRLASFVKEQVVDRIQAVESRLLELSAHPGFPARDLSVVSDAVYGRLAGETAVEEVFLAFWNEKPLYPLLQTLHSPYGTSPLTEMSGALQDRLHQAEIYEFAQMKYGSALAIYRQMLSQASNPHIQAQMLIRIGRCYFKRADYAQAIRVYSRIPDEFSHSASDSGLPLALIARLQILECSRKIKDSISLLEDALDLYRDLLEAPWS